MLAYLVIAHLVGDFLLQNDYMQAKSRNSSICTLHVAVYSVPFWGIGLPIWAYSLIMIQHWLQDRYGLHLIWMKLYGQTPPDKWPVGPLCIDQAMHLAFIAGVCHATGL